MKLTIKDRLILANQYKILEALYPKEANEYAKHRKAIEQGYALHYSWTVEWFYDEMSEDDCQEVIDILNMYRAIWFSYLAIEDKSGVEDEYMLKFKGFDGNEESSQYGYAEYFINDLNRFQELKYGEENRSLNSHHSYINSYRIMLACWQDMGKPYNMNKTMLKKLLTCRSNEDA